MAKHIPVRPDPLTVELEPWIDTNYTYELMWDARTEAWIVNPVALRPVEEARPF